MSNGLPTSSNYIETIHVTESHVFVGTSSNGVFYSTDNGANWTAANNGIPSNTLVSSITSSGTNIFAGTHSGVYLSTDDGINWTAVNNGLSNTFISELTIIGTDIYAGITHGGVWKAALSDFHIITSTGSFKDYGIEIYPGIVKDKLSISAPDLQNNARISIFNLYGKVVYSSVITGSFSDIDMTRYISGIYIVKIYIQGNIVLTRKIVKQ
jgi:ligand-binding sensor domain-containing protein